MNKFDRIPPISEAFDGRESIGFAGAAYFDFGMVLPEAGEPGIVQIEARRDAMSAGYGLWGQVEDLAKIYDTPIRGIMQRLNIRALKSRESGRLAVRCEFPGIADLDATLQELNRQLPPSRHLPGLKPIKGGLYRSRDYVSAVAEGKVLLATGRSESQATDEMGRPPAWFAMHEVATHLFAAILKTTPAVREGLAEGAQAALDTDPTVKGPDCLNAVQRYMGNADYIISSAGIGADLVRYPNYPIDDIDLANMLLPMMVRTPEQVSDLVRTIRPNLARLVEVFPPVEER